MGVVGQRLRAIRESRGISQEALGRALNMAGATISRYEAGKAFIRADFLPAVAEALDADPCAFFSEHTNMDALMRDDLAARRDARREPVPPVFYDAASTVAARLETHDGAQLPELRTFANAILKRLRGDVLELTASEQAALEAHLRVGLELILAGREGAR